MPTVKYSIEHSAHVNVIIGNTALDFSSLKGYFEIVKYLVKNKANINAHNGSAIKHAFATKHFDIITYLVNNEAEYNEKRNFLNDTMDTR